MAESNFSSVAVVAMVLGPVAGSTTAMAPLMSVSVVRLLNVMVIASLVLAPAWMATTPEAPADPSSSFWPLNWVLNRMFDTCDASAFCSAVMFNLSLVE